MSDEVAFGVSGGVARITLNRPDKRNSLDSATIAALCAALSRCAEDSATRVVQISGAGSVFCAGLDMREMQAQSQASEADNLDHAKRLSNLFGVLNSLPKPTLARVNGDGYGGALGLLAACDIVVCVESAQFAFTEVRLGIIPATISPFVLGKISESAARRYFLTAETITATTLKQLGLVHEVVPQEQLDAVCGALIEALLKGAPRALAHTKALIRDVIKDGALDRTQTSARMAERLARLRVQAEAQEGFDAFFAKRRAAWRLESN